MPIRLKIATGDSISSYKEISINPHIYNPQDNSFIANSPVLHSANVYQDRGFDYRERTLEWDSFSATSPGIMWIATYFRESEGEIRYLHFGDISSFNNNWPSEAVSPSTASWKKARIINVQSRYSPGGKLKYDYLRVVVQPEE